VFQLWGGGRKPEGYIEIKSPQSSTWLKLGAGKGGLVYLRTCPGVLKQPVQFLLSASRNRRPNDDKNIRVQTELVAHFQKSCEAIGRATMLSCGIFAWIRALHVF
jgi:hypothetical protein